ncbi:nitrate reductase, partial [Thermodesulfobacteriota bacterium]
MYTFLAGPALWVTFVFFIGGMTIRIIYLFSLSRVKDQVFYNHIKFSWGVKSIFYWLLPLGSVSLRSQPIFSIALFVFHLSLLATPLFLCAHNILWDEAFGISLWFVSDSLADAMTILLVLTGLFLFLRRLVRAEVRVLTEKRDYALLLLTMLPFITGFFAYHQIGPYQLMLILHILSGEILLILIPLTKLGHMVL